MRKKFLLFTGLVLAFVGLLAPAAQADAWASHTLSFQCVGSNYSDIYGRIQYSKTTGQVSVDRIYLDSSYNIAGQRMNFYIDKGLATYNTQYVYRTWSSSTQSLTKVFSWPQQFHPATSSNPQRVEIKYQNPMGNTGSCVYSIY